MSLGPLLREHKVTLLGQLNWLGAAALGVGFCGWLGSFAWRQETLPLKTSFGVLVLAGASAWALVEWNRLRRLSLSFHTAGLNFRLGETSSSVPWSEVLALEARYVPGLLKRGISDEGNCVSFLILTANSGWLELPKELEAFPEVRTTIAQRTGITVQQVLIQNLTQR